MKGLYKRGKTYWMDYSVNGRMQYESTKKTTVRDAEIVLADRKREVRDGTMPDINKVKNYKFVELAEVYLKWAERQALLTGMRKSEILDLQWKQVDLKHGFILLDKTKNGERREIPIDTTLEEMFNEMPHSIW